MESKNFSKIMKIKIIKIILNFKIIIFLKKININIINMKKIMIMNKILINFKLLINNNQIIYFKSRLFKNNSSMNNFNKIFHNIMKKINKIITMKKFKKLKNLMILKTLLNKE